MHTTTVAIVGKPNVGKSTLFNRLIGQHAAITQNVPGVTRDRIYGRCSWLEKHFSLIDTGGLMPVADDPMMSFVQLQTRIAIDEADVIVCLFDAQQELTATDYEVVELLRHSNKPIYYVANKIDSPTHEVKAHHLYQLGIDHVISISAEHKLGLDILLDAICEHVAVPDAEDDEAQEIIMRIAVVGRPNVGKSSFVNHLLGEDRMLVTDIAGTTRDAIDSRIEVNGSRYVFIDTSGIRRKSKIHDPVERYSVIRAFKSIDRCHLAFLLIDAERGIADQEAHIASYANNAGRAVVLVVNKWDLIEKDSSTAGAYVQKVKQQLKFLDHAPVIFTSALTGQRVRKTLHLADQVFAQYNQRVPTSRINAALEQMVARHHPPVHKGRQVKLYYAAQSAVRPPTFVLFSNAPEGVHFSYKRYLINQFREHFQLPSVPIKLRIQQR